MSDRIANSYAPMLPCHRVNAALLVVLVEGERGDQAAYAGLVDRSAVVELGPRRTEAENWVRTSGSKLTYQQALGYFPRLQQERYR